MKELWFYNEVMPEVQAKVVIATCRLGDRVVGTLNPKGGFCFGDTVKLRFHDGLGHLGQEHFSSWSTLVRVKAIVLTSWGHVNESWLQGVPRCEQSKQDLRLVLEKAGGSAITEATRVTLIGFCYLDEPVLYREE
jgi:hypothetical protein